MIATKPIHQERIPTYYSHSYWHHDYEVNLHFHRQFWIRGFAFTVDPPSEFLSLARLELMMRRSACFVAVATYRQQERNYKTSPFVVYEHGLAVQAQKPRLVFLEQGVASKFFAGSEQVYFRRDNFEAVLRRPRVREILDEFEAMSRPYTCDADRPLGSVGLILPSTPAYRRARPVIRKLLEDAGYGVEDVRNARSNVVDLAQEVDRHDFVVVDVGVRRNADWPHPWLTGRFIPMLRLAHVERTRAAESHMGPVRRAPGSETVLKESPMMLLWASVDEIAEQLETEVAKLQRLRQQFRTSEEGDRYFVSLERAIDLPIFISNASPDNDLARDLSRVLDINNIPFFHYVYKNTIEVGDNWLRRLRDRVERSRLFIPMVTRAYWQSEWCRMECSIALDLQERGLIEIHPCFLEEPGLSAGPLGSVQGLVLAGLPPEAQVDRILTDVDSFLRKPPLESASTRPTEPSPTPAWFDELAPSVDVAIVTVLPEEYAAVLAQLDRHWPARSSLAQPNRYSWEVGEILPPGGGRAYRVVLGLAGDQGTTSGFTVVQEAIEIFRPGYVLLVGIAGGFGATRVGDVVVSELIYGYEYGKVVDGGEFAPRPNWVYRTAKEITTAARTMSVRHVDWFRHAAGVGQTPSIHVGPVASGNKVVDDASAGFFRKVLEFWPKLIAVEMEGLGAAEAIEEARELRRPVSFAMVRGISDTPRTDQAPERRRDQSAEREQWKAAACHAAATFATQLIRLSWPYPPQPPGAPSTPRRSDVEIQTGGVSFRGVTNIDRSTVIGGDVHGDVK